MLVRDSNIEFRSDENILSLTNGEPVLILHAEDDPTIPYALGKDLYNEAR